MIWDLNYSWVLEKFIQKYVFRDNKPKLVSERN